jgi:hypothetical protein
VKFDDDLITEVQAQAPPGVHFEDDEVRAALVKVVDGKLPIVLLGVRPAVERAALHVMKARCEQTQPAEDLR